MNDYLQALVFEFLQEQIDDEPIQARPDSFWSALKTTGTEIWLDTGDMEEAAKIWTAEMTALTTNNTLLNMEIQKGIYDDFILRAKKVVSSLPLHEQVQEISFMLNARHGLRLVKRFGGYVSVELHTDTAYDIDAIVAYGERFHRIQPDKFIIKVPYTAEGLLGARKLGQAGIPVNFTLEFSARQNVLVSLIAKPQYLNVFLGRIGAYLKDNNLGDGSGAGERAVLSSQQWITKLKEGREVVTRLIAASLRSADQLEKLAGVDVFTIPVKVAADGRTNLSGNFSSRLNTAYPVPLNDSAKNTLVEKFWEVSDAEVSLAKEIDANPPSTGKEIVKKAQEAGLSDLFPPLSEEEKQFIASDGKIPKFARWEKQIRQKKLAPDTLLNLAGLASFTQDQNALDARIRKLISA
mgnify:CR=1 FL=1